MNYQNEIKIIKSIVNKTIQNNNKILVCGNGGSASDSNHIVAEFVGKFERKRPGWCARKIESAISGDLSGHAANVCQDTGKCHGMPGDYPL